jgi:integrase
MSVRKRTWTTAKGETREKWVVNYSDSDGKRRLKTFPTQKEAKSWAAKTTIEIERGVHTADSRSVTVAKAGQL